MPQYEILLMEEQCIVFHMNQMTINNQKARVYLDINYPDSKVHGANAGPTWVLPAPDGPHVGPMNIAIMVSTW